MIFLLLWKLWNNTKTMTKLFIIIFASFVFGAVVNAWNGWWWGALFNLGQGSFWVLCAFISSRAKEVE